MLSNYEKTIIDKLLDKYESSKTFLGDNKVQQKFSVNITSLFPEYADHSNYEAFDGINLAIDTLKGKHLINAKSDRANVYHNLTLNSDSLENAYTYINRLPKKTINDSVIDLIEKYSNKSDILNRYYRSQEKRIKANKGIEFFKNSKKELENILIAIVEMQKVETETYMRDFSVRVFKDSKVFEKISPKVVKLLFKYGDFPEKEHILASQNIIKNPTYVNFKGAGTITVKGQRIDLDKLDGDIAISTSILMDINSIEVKGRAVVTVENLTSFHKFNDKNMFMIYLGGFHNTIRRQFIQKLYAQNPNLEYLHFGDIDAGGFYIFEHLRTMTGISFQPYKMDQETLRQYSNYTKKLTANDRKRLLNLQGGKFKEVIDYMLKNNCKLEQEAINNKINM
jgi:hypothetical protein